MAGHPLLSWDIAVEGISRRMEFANDFKALERVCNKNHWNFRLKNYVLNSLIWENKIIIVTNSLLEIVLATKNIEQMNGYEAKEVIGKTPKIFQGPATTAAEKKIIRTAIAELKPFDIVITNYRKEGTEYKCHIEGYPVFDTKGKNVNFIAMENIFIK